MRYEIMEQLAAEVTVTIFRQGGLRRARIDTMVRDMREMYEDVLSLFAKQDIEERSVRTEATPASAE